MVRLYRDADVFDRCGTFTDHSIPILQYVEHVYADSNKQVFKPLQFFDTSRSKDLQESLSAAAFKIQVEAIIRKHSQGGVVFFDKIGEDIYKLHNDGNSLN